MGDKIIIPYTRKYADGERVSLEDLATVYRFAAQLVVSHGDEYLPLFNRLASEVDSQEERQSMLDRAAEIARRTDEIQPDSPTPKK